MTPAWSLETSLNLESVYVERLDEKKTRVTPELVTLLLSSLIIYPSPYKKWRTSGMVRPGSLQASVTMALMAELLITYSRRWP